MTYIAAYDVRDAGYLMPLMGTALAALIGSGILFFSAFRVRAGRGTVQRETAWRKYLFAAIVVGCIALAQGLGGYAQFDNRRACIQHMQNGEFTITEGTVERFEITAPSRGGAEFVVDGKRFDYWGGTCAFTGRFNQPNVPEESLRTGAKVRVFHNSGRILRIEIAAE